MKKISIVLFAAAVFALAACGGGGEKKPDEKKSRLFGFTSMDLSDQFQIAVKDTIQAAVEANGDSLAVVDARTSQEIQNDGINDMITQGIELLFLIPRDSKGILPALEALKEAKIPVINVDTAVMDRDFILTYIASNNVTAGYQCGQEIVRLYPEGARVVLIEAPTAESVVHRVQGLEKAMEGTPSRVIDRKITSSSDAILNTCEDILQANPQIDVFWGLNDIVGLAALGAVEGAGRKEIKVISVDGTPAGKISVQKGGLWATAAQSPINIGKKAVECAYKYFAGETLEKEYSIETKLINPDNVAQNDPENWG